MTRPVPIQFGHGWIEPSGRRGAVTWNPQTGQVLYEKAAGGVELLAVIVEEAMVRTRLIDWAEHMFEGVEWVRRRVAPWACPCCHGEGWIGTNFFCDTEQPIPCPACNSRVAS